MDDRLQLRTLIFLEAKFETKALETRIHAEWQRMAALALPTLTRQFELRCEVQSHTNVLLVSSRLEELVARLERHARIQGLEALYVSVRTIRHLLDAHRNARTSAEARGLLQALSGHYRQYR